MRKIITLILFSVFMFPVLSQAEMSQKDHYNNSAIWHYVHDGASEQSNQNQNSTQQKEAEESLKSLKKYFDGKDFNNMGPFEKFLYLFYLYVSVSNSNSVSTSNQQ